jgi:hypothetical protein
VFDLTGLPALDLAIGLSFIFLILSLLASAVQEGIASLLALRAKTLLRGLRNMLDGTEEKSTDNSAASLEFYKHPLIRSLYRPAHGLLKRFATGDERLPSYIAPRSFALALLDTVAPDIATDPKTQQKRDDLNVVAYVTTALESANLPPEARRALLALVKDARGDIDTFRQNVEAWFDDSMARVSGWYKRQSQLILLALAVVVVLALNANTLTIGERLWKDPAVRAAVVQEAGKVEQPGATGDEAQEDAQARLEEALENVDRLEKLGVPLGWTANVEDPRHVSVADDPWRFVYHDILGWLLTVIAISLGAPFWFDTLSRLSRLRSTGKPEQPLPASGYGRPNERVVTARPTRTPTRPAATPPAPATAGGPPAPGSSAAPEPPPDSGS